MFNVSITNSTDSADQAGYEYADHVAALDFLISYVNDEFNESNGRVPHAALCRVIAIIAEWGAAGGVEPLNFSFDGEVFDVAVPTPQPPKLIVNGVLDHDALAMACTRPAKPLVQEFKPDDPFFDVPPVYAAHMAHTAFVQQWPEGADLFARHFAACVELFSSQAWQHMGAQGTLTIIGFADTEHELHEPVMGHGGFYPVALSGSYRLRVSHHNGGFIGQVLIDDEGYSGGVVFNFTK